MKTAIEEARDRLRIAYKYYPASFREGFIDCLLIFERHYATPTQQYAEELKKHTPLTDAISIAEPSGHSMASYQNRQDLLKLQDKEYAKLRDAGIGIKSPMPQNEVESVSGAYFITTQEGLSQETFDRLKKQIDEAWPNNLPRPILLEGCNIVKL